MKLLTISGILIKRALHFDLFGRSVAVKRFSIYIQLNWIRVFILYNTRFGNMIDCVADAFCTGLTHIESFCFSYSIDASGAAT